MPVHFEQELEELKQRVVAMGAAAETAVERALQALEERDEVLALRIKEEDRILDKLEVEVDDMAIHLLAKAPLASDLRFITTAMKISHDLERVGDEATTIARRTRQLIGQEQPGIRLPIPSMAELVVQMLKAAITSFIQRDPIQARAIIPDDKEVDSLNKQVYRELAGYMVANPQTVNVCLHLMFIAKCLERIGDHATNIAEEVVFLCEALDIRHNPQVKQGVGS